MKVIDILMPVALIALTLTGCSKPTMEPRPPETPLTAPDEVVSKYQPMSNDEIIAETKKCEVSDLNAESLKVEKEWGALTVKIQCVPRLHKD